MLSAVLIWPPKEDLSLLRVYVKAADNPNALIWAPTPSVLMYREPAPCLVSSKPSNPAKPILFPPPVEKDRTPMSLGKLVRSQPGLTSGALLCCVSGTVLGVSEGVRKTQTGGPVPVSVSLRELEGRVPAMWH